LTVKVGSQEFRMKAKGA